MRKGKLQLSFLPAPPLVWIFLDAGGGLTFDTPYAPGLKLDPKSAAVWAAEWTDKQRAHVHIPFVISTNEKVISLRAVTLSREWVRPFCQAADAAIRRDMKR